MLWWPPVREREVCMYSARLYALTGTWVGSLLGNSNRGELEHSGRYAYGQFEWELDQRVLGLAVKMWGHCCPSSTAAPHADMPTEAQAHPRFQTESCWQIALPKRAMLDRLEQWPPDGAAGGAATGVDVLNGRIMAHLPMQVLPLEMMPLHRVRCFEGEAACAGGDGSTPRPAPSCSGSLRSVRARL